MYILISIKISSLIFMIIQSLVSNAQEHKIFLVYFLYNSFSEIEFMYHTIYPLKFTVVFSLFTELYSHHHVNFITFLFFRMELHTY